MNFRDTLVTCQECGKQFVDTVEKQRSRAESGQDAAAPELCPQCRQTIRYDGRYHGRVKWFDLDKGFGFIVQDAGDEIFFHRTSVKPAEGGGLPALEENQEVLYDVNHTTKGPAAVEVEPYNG